MTLLTAAALLLLAPMLAVALLNLLFAPRLERASAPASTTRVNLLIPARDEEVNLRTSLPALLRLPHPGLEILVLDDGSRDGTADLVRAEAGRSGGRLRLVVGRPLPDGWLGKNWACHQLAEAAGGELLIFCDADVTVGPRAVQLTLAAMEEAGAGALSALPRQRLDHWAAHAVVPLVTQLPVLALLPLPLVPRSRSPALSFGNGQWFAFRREVYQATGGHAAVRSEVVEDVVLGRRVKSAGHRLLPVVARDELHVRMYPDRTSLREGFAKNLFALVGARTSTLALALVVFGLTAVHPWAAVALGSSAALLPLALLLAIRVCGMVVFRHGIGTVLLHPLGSLILPWLGLDSYLGSSRGVLRWKGRPLAGAADR